MKAKKESKGGSDTPGADEEQEDLDDEECSMSENNLELKPKMIESSKLIYSNDQTSNAQQINGTLSESSSNHPANPRVLIGSNNIANENMHHNNVVPTPNIPFNMQQSVQPILS